jgi:hypothetical protein
MSTTLLGDWYANILYTRQGHYILCVSEKSLLPIILSAKDLDTLMPRFLKQLSDVLISIGIPNPSVTKEIGQMSNLEIGRTKSKVVLGSMNDFVYNFKYMLPERMSYTFTEWSLNLAETPCGPLHFQSPIEVTHKIFDI